MLLFEIHAIICILRMFRMPVDTLSTTWENTGESWEGKKRIYVSHLRDLY